MYNIVFLITSIIFQYSDDMPATSIITGTIEAIIKSIIVIFLLKHFTKKNKDYKPKKEKIDAPYKDSERKKIYLNKGFTYEDACENYCKQNNKQKDELTEKDYKIENIELEKQKNKLY